MRVLVTGGAGFIGSHLVDALVERGDDAVVLDDLSTGRRENLAAALERGAELRVGTIADPAATAAAFEAARADAVFHLAAQMDVRRSIADPVHDAAVNVVGTVNVLEAARQRGGPRVILASTGGMVYGEGDGRELPLAEDAELRPENPYGFSKIAAEGYVDLYRRIHDVPGLSLRLGNVYGPRQDPHGEAGVVAIFCGLLLDGGQPTVYGDGRQTRDYIYIADAVEGLLAAEAALARSGDALDGAYNVGSGRETSVLELLERLGALAGRTDLEPRLEPPRLGEIGRISIDCARAAEAFGWRASTDLEVGLERTLAAFRRARPRIRGAAG